MQKNTVVGTSIICCQRTKSEHFKKCIINALSKSRANYCRCFRDETRGHLAATLRCPKLPANTAKSSECLNCRLIKLKNHAFKFPYSEFLL